MDERKAKLEALRNKRKRQEEEDGGAADGDEEAVKQVKFRNYEPHAEELREEGEGDSKVKRAKVAHTLTDTVEGEVANIVSKALEESEVVNLVAKRPNWDLKRDVEAKLNQLNRATQIAIVKMNRERMEEEEEEEGEGEEN